MSKEFIISSEALQKVSMLEEKLHESELCIKHGICFNCAAEMKVNNESVLDYYICPNENCDVAYDFNKMLWTTKSEITIVNDDSAL